MEKEQIMSMRHQLMTRLESELQDELIAAQLSNPETDGRPEILNILFDELGPGDIEAFGEFFFRPLETEEDEVQFFSGIITLSDDLPDEHLAELFEAISYINFQIPCGSFSVDKEHTFLTFRLCAPLPFNLSEETLYQEMNILMGNAVAIVDGYMELLLGIADGSLTVGDAIDVLGGTEDE